MKGTQSISNVNFDLSKRIGLKEYPVRNAFTKEDVKEFIRLLKEFINNSDRDMDNMRISRDYTIIKINKLAGKGLR